MALCAGGKLRSVGGADGKLVGYSFWCLGCGHAHLMRTVPHGSQACWSFNGNVERPTFGPSLLVTWNEPANSGKALDDEIAALPAGGRVQMVAKRCHSFIRDGNIQFLADCTHKLAGQTTPIPPWPPEHMEFQDNHDGGST